MIRNPQTPLEALAMALQLALTAPDDQKAAMAVTLAEQLIADGQLTPKEIEAAKALAAAATD